jgi:hypothetical protein
MRCPLRPWVILLPLWWAGSAWAGPPFVLDDPEPTENGHWEIYAFANGTSTQEGSGGEAGMDFNYGGAEDIQLTAVFPVGYSRRTGIGLSAGLGNIEIAAKYRFLRQDDFGLDVAVFPRVFLPSGSSEVGERHVSLLLPVWLEKDWGDWSAFGGGGCTLNNGGGSQNFCIAGGVLMRRILPNLHLGGELYHQTADVKGGSDNTSLGAGAIYDLSSNYHVLGYLGTGIQNARATNELTWYASALFTF